MLYSLTALFYVICCVVAPIVLGSVPTRMQLAVSLWALMIGFILFGPSPTLGLPNKYWLMCTSSLFSGFGFCMPSILFSRQVKVCLMLRYNIVEGSNDMIERRLNDLNSLCFLLAQTAGTLIAPLIGALTYEWKGHRMTCDIFALSYLIIAVLLTVFYMGFKPYEDARNDQERLDHLAGIAAQLKMLRNGENYDSASADLETPSPDKKKEAMGFKT